MADILRVDIPKDITENGGILQHVDNLKRMISLYACQVEPRYKNARPLDDEIGSVMGNVNPKSGIYSHILWRCQSFVTHVLKEAVQ
jgi:hypothetical protein